LRPPNGLPIALKTPLSYLDTIGLGRGLHGRARPMR
jgi:hypothetical protein